MLEVNKIQPDLKMKKTAQGLAGQANPFPFLGFQLGRRICHCDAFYCLSSRYVWLVFFWLQRTAFVFCHHQLDWRAFPESFTPSIGERPSIVDSGKVGPQIWCQWWIEKKFFKYHSLSLSCLALSLSYFMPACNWISQFGHMRVVFGQSGQHLDFWKSWKFETIFASEKK